MMLSSRSLGPVAFVLTILPGIHGAETQAAGRTASTPVLLELFTSEGCSSCPPADKLLEEMDRKQPIEGADLIVLSEHVDYWNRLGWSDPYSSRVFTGRQQEYASRLGESDIYTPELVVDGSRSLVGSDWTKAKSAIKESLRDPKIAVSVRAERKQEMAQVRVNVEGSASKQRADVYVVVARDRAKSQVSRGENAGRDLSHVAVAYSISNIATIKPGSVFEKDLSISLPPKSRPGDMRLIVFVRRSDTTKIIGVAHTHL